MNGYWNDIYLLDCYIDCTIYAFILASSIPRLFVNPSSQMYLVKLVEKDFDDQVIYVIC